jgi:hypothetical protein
MIRITNLTKLQRRLFHPAEQQREPCYTTERTLQSSRENLVVQQIEPNWHAGAVFIGIEGAF